MSKAALAFFMKNLTMSLSMLSEEKKQDVRKGFLEKGKLPA